MTMIMKNLPHSQSFKPFFLYCSARSMFKELKSQHSANETEWTAKFVKKFNNSQSVVKLKSGKGRKSSSSFLLYVEMFFFLLQRNYELSITFCEDFGRSVNEPEGVESLKASSELDFGLRTHAKIFHVDSKPKKLGKSFTRASEISQSSAS